VAVVGGFGIGGGGDVGELGVGPAGDLHAAAGEEEFAVGGDVGSAEAAGLKGAEVGGFMDADVGAGFGLDAGEDLWVADGPPIAETDAADPTDAGFGFVDGAGGIALVELDGVVDEVVAGADGDGGGGAGGAELVTSFFEAADAIGRGDGEDCGQEEEGQHSAVAGIIDYEGSGIVKVRDVIKMIENDGWQIDRMTGSHRHYYHPTKKGIVTVAGHPSADIDPGTLASVCRQAQVPKPKRN